MPTCAGGASRSIIAGRPSAERRHAFCAVDPRTSDPLGGEHFAATAEEVDRAAARAAEAFMAGEPAGPALLRQVAQSLQQHAGAIVPVVMEETALPEARVRGELARTGAQLEFFASIAERGAWVRAVIDHGDSARQPTPRPDLRRMLRPLGPVAVFGAGNFPLAYSTAGGDTASALAAGCPVIVKGHPGHPRSGAMVAELVTEAAARCGAHPGVFSYLHAGGEREFAIGAELVQHEGVSAVGFTGSFKGGMAIHALAGGRRRPIPVFAEMGSTNPVVVLPRAAERNREEIVTRLAASITASVGQMCTCPGVVLVPTGSGPLVRGLAERVAQAGVGTMLSPRVREVFEERRGAVAGVLGAKAQRAGAGGLQGDVISTDARTFLAHGTLHEEVFGPLAIAVEWQSAEELRACLWALGGSLTVTLWSEPEELAEAQGLMGVLERLAGRVIHNGVPTGVEVVGATVHGGPFPATNQPHSSAGGSLAMERWCRPVCYQSVPDGMLPPALREGNPLGIDREVNGAVVLRGR
ncbi:MAG: aldehyde dehydrogenase (NADP(+)) [Phycisphaerales bacterium]